MNSKGGSTKFRKMRTWLKMTTGVAFYAVALMAPVTASAERLTLWMRDNGATLASRVIDHWTKPIQPTTSRVP